MIWITGDCHRDYTRFAEGNFPEQKEMTKDDFVIILGDFGYWDDSKDQEKLLDWLDARPFTTLWIDGNHENYDLLKKFEVERWHCGKVQFIRPSIIHLMRGQVFEIGDDAFFTFGGAASHDISGGIIDINEPGYEEAYEKAKESGLPFRFNHISWWKEEMPSEEEYAEGLKNLARYGNRVDYILTHCAGTKTQEMLAPGRYEVNRLTDYIDEILESVRYRLHFFGHMHANLAVGKRELLLYKQMIRLR